MKNLFRRFTFVAFLFSCLLLFPRCTKQEFGYIAPPVTVSSTALPSVEPAAPPPAVPVVPDAIFSPADIPEFKCLSIVALDSASVIDVPPRTDNGICFATKLMGAIPSSPSSLTPDSDSDVVSNDHENANSVRHPYLMARKTFQVNLHGIRKLKLSGAADDRTSILVDNFVLVGFGPVNTKLNYRAYGSADSAIGTTGAIKLNDVAIPLESFSTGGVATLGLLDITQSIQTDAVYEVDVRAEDCGSARNLSDIYLLFQ